MLLDGFVTDPEPDMGGEQITARNMRSKCRCSYVLQFTFRRAVCRVLHRPPSQVIHCIVLFFNKVSVDRIGPIKQTDVCTSPHEGGARKNLIETGEVSSKP